VKSDYASSFSGPFQGWFIMKLCWGHWSVRKTAASRGNLHYDH
jgi:hypothetical protein